ncbi:hypothetical protein M9H77_08791 [Catharanthus roseus]|uniref:Uncharacterized protein n=1 Tax=Catharanthus roseus TaxID=4058 RepID=A0ACC0BYZ4_CATRO|nr:hypothetical protein M9H77_08791 [Catharanthus roseus]
MSFFVIDNLGTEVLSVDAHHVLYFIDELTLTVVLPPLIVGSLINQSMEDIDEGFEEDSDSEVAHNVEGRDSSRSDLDQGRKRMRVALKGVSTSKIVKKARAVTPLKANNAINKHLYSKTVELRMVELIDKPILAKKRITEESLDQYKVMELLLRIGYVELALFVYVRGYIIDFSPANIIDYLSCSHYSDIEGTSLEEEVDLDEVTKVLTGDAGAFWPEINRLNSNLMKMSYRAMFRVFYLHVIPKTTFLGVALPSPTLSTQGHTGPSNSTKAAFSGVKEREKMEAYSFWRTRESFLPKDSHIVSKVRLKTMPAYLKYTCVLCVTSLAL